MKVGDFDFEYVGDIEPSRDAGGAILAFHPQSRYKKSISEAGVESSLSRSTIYFINQAAA